MATFDFRTRLNDDGLSKRLDKKAEQIAPEVIRRVNRMLSTVKINVQAVTPRGEHCTGDVSAPGTTKSAIRQKITPSGGDVYVDEGIAPWAKWLIGGRGPVEAKYAGTYLGKKIGGAKVLHFCIAHKDIFVRKVGPSKPNDIMGKGFRLSLKEVESQGKEMADWITKV